MVKQFYTSVRAAFKSVPFPLYIFTIQLLLQSTGTTPLLTTSLQISVTHFTPASSAAFNISAATPDGPAALPLFALDIAELTSDTDISFIHRCLYLVHFTNATNTIFISIKFLI